MTNTANARPQLPNRDLLIKVGLPVIPLLIAALILFLLSRPPAEPWLASVPTLTEIRANSPERLQATFERHGFHWPPSGAVPPLKLATFPSGMSEMTTDERKALFFRALLPLILAENEAIAATRQHFLQLHERLNANPDAEIGPREQALVDYLQARYPVEGELKDRATRERLLLRLDIVPVSLALAQAANESGWGTSRFTREANNLFGEWTWNEDVGLLPKRRVEGATHFIRMFPDLHSSVRSYIHNLNTGHAYAGFRQLRANLRQEGQTPDGLTLAGGLERYSERGQAYIQEIRSMIRQNDLHTLPDDLRLNAEGRDDTSGDGSQ